jgi:hypothetical protein
VSRFIYDLKNWIDFNPLNAEIGFIKYVYVPSFVLMFPW